MSPVVGWLAAVGLVACAVLVNTDLILPEIRANNTKMPVALKLNSFKMCPEHMDVPSTYDNMSLYMEPENEHTLYVDGILNMKEDIPNGTMLIIDIRRCYDEREVSCEKYIIQEVEDVCSYLPQQGQIWSTFVKQIEGLDPICPIAAGSYRMNEATVDMSRYQNESEFTGHWQIEMSFTNGDKRYGCIVLDSTISLRNDAIA